jgi:hypothetical protein
VFVGRWTRIVKGRSAVRKKSTCVDVARTPDPTLAEVQVEVAFGAGMCFDRFKACQIFPV